MVWIAGPLSGLIVQPVIGVISDGSRSRWGRRRPFIAVGSVIVALAMFTLGFTKEIVGVFISDKGTAKAVTIVLAVLSLYTTDFAINAGWFHEVHGFVLAVLTKTRDSYVMFSKLDCGYAANVETTGWRRLG